MMNILDLKSQLQVGFDTLFDKTNATHGEDKYKYEYLLKDVPYNENGVPYIMVCGYSKMTISIGSLAYSRNLMDFVQEQTDKVRSVPGCKFELTAELKTGHWPLGLGFQRLGEFVAFLGNKEIGYEHWHRLTISLPDLELPYDMLSHPIIPPGSFANLVHLTWRGHRKQLLTSWFPLAPSILRTLTTLEIQCDIALQDCCYLLYHGSNLKNVTIKIIQKELAHEQVSSFIAPPGCTSRPLEYLHLVSDDDIGPLLLPFSFPSLQRIRFILGYPTMSSFTELKIWETLETIRISGHLSDEDCNWIRSQCGPTTQYDFNRTRMLMKGARSFLHNHSDYYYWPFSPIGLGPQ